MKLRHSVEQTPVAVPSPEQPSLPAALLNHLPEHLTGSELAASNRLYDVRRNCEEILAIEGQKMPSRNFAHLTVGTTAIEIDAGVDSSLFARMYKGETRDKEAKYGFILSGTPEPATNYDGYSLLRIELALNGSYELVAGGGDKSPDLNDAEVIDLLSNATEDHKNKLVQQQSNEQRKARRKKEERVRVALTIGANCVTGCVAVAAIGFGAKKTYDVITPDHSIPEKKLTYVHQGQSATPTQVGNWTKKDGQQDFQRIVFTANTESPEKTPTQCKSVPIEDSTRTQVTSIVDYTRARDFWPDKDLSSQFRVAVKGKLAEVCWDPSLSDYDEFNTLHPTVGVKTIYK